MYKTYVKIFCSTIFSCILFFTVMSQDHGRTSFGLDYTSQLAIPSEKPIAPWLHHNNAFTNSLGLNIEMLLRERLYLCYRLGLNTLEIRESDRSAPLPHSDGNFILLDTLISYTLSNSSGFKLILRERSNQIFLRPNIGFHVNFYDKNKTIERFNSVVDPQYAVSNRHEFARSYYTFGIGFGYAINMKNNRRLTFEPTMSYTAKAIASIFPYYPYKEITALRFRKFGIRIGYQWSSKD